MIVIAAVDPIGDFINNNPWVLGVGFPIFFVTMWLVILNFISRLSGWASLAEHYRATGPVQSEKWWFQSAQMRYLCHYNGCLTFGANEMGMYAAGWGPFRIGAAPLLVPWGELDITQKTRWLFAGYELRFRQSPDVYMWSGPALARNCCVHRSNRRPAFAWPRPSVRKISQKARSAMPVKHCASPVSCWDWPEAVHSMNRGRWHPPYSRKLQGLERTP